MYMRHQGITPKNTEFVLISFEGPDGYSLAGGLGVRMTHLSQTLAETGFTTHLFFIGDPNQPGEEVKQNGKLILHRWCQWISQYHPCGVYDGEESKLRDFNQSIPGFVKDRIIKPALAKGKLVAVLAEEWQTAEAVCQLSRLLHREGLRDRVIIFWNANNTYSFKRVDWTRLSRAATITTVSRYMKHVMDSNSTNTLVVPNGIPKSALQKVDDRMALGLRQALGRDMVLCKVARWHPDKRWNEAVGALAKLKRKGIKAVLLAIGGLEAYGGEVLENARSMGLTVTDVKAESRTFEGRLTSLTKTSPADLINIKSHIPLDFLSIMYRAADAVLANSGHEPFGLVGLEAMAAGGVVFTGGTGEDYAIPFVNSFMIESSDPMEMVGYLTYLQNNPEAGMRIRTAARITARYFTWEAALQSLISKIENQARIQGVLDDNTILSTLRLNPVDWLAYDQPRQSTHEVARAQELLNTRR